MFQTTQRLVPEDNDGGLSDLYVRANGQTTLASGPTGVGDPAKAAPTFRGISADGSQIFFTTTERLDPADNDGGRSDVYVHTTGGGTNLVSQSTGVPDPASAAVGFARASRDGHAVAFVTTQKMTSDDHNKAADLYVRSGGVTSLVSVCPFNDSSPDAIHFAGATPDLSTIVFQTKRRCVSGDRDSSRQDVYVRAGGTTTWASGPNGVKDADTGPVSFDRISQDGAHVIMDTAQPLTAGDGDKVADVYDHTSGGTTLVSQATGVADPGAAVRRPSPAPRRTGPASSSRATAASPRTTATPPAGTSTCVPAARPRWSASPAGCPIPTRRG